MARLEAAGGKIDLTPGWAGSGCFGFTPWLMRVGEG